MNNKHSNNKNENETEISKCISPYVRTKNRIFMLCEDLINKIFEYTDPYRENYREVIFSLSWHQYWYNYLSSCFYSIRKKPFYKYFLLKKRQVQKEDMDNFDLFPSRSR